MKRRKRRPNAKSEAERRERLREATRRWLKRHPKKAKAVSLDYRNRNRKLLSQRTLEWKAKNPEKAAALAERSKAKMPIYRRKYNALHRKQITAAIRERRQTDASLRLATNLRNRINGALRGKRKSARTAALLGCTIDSFWIYLESKFQEGMTRDNYGTVWEVDHELPCAIFDMSNPEHQARCFHFSNLQPLFTMDNRRKNAKLPSEWEGRCRTPVPEQP